MSRKYIVIIIVVAALAAAAVGANAWFNSYYKSVDASGIPVTPIKVAGQDVLPVGADFTMPLFGDAEVRFPNVMGKVRSVLGDRLEKQLDCLVTDDGNWWVIPENTVFDMPDPTPYLGMLGEVPYALDFEMPDVMHWNVTLKYIDEAGKETTIYIGGGAQRDKPQGLTDEVVILKAGEYAFSAEGTLSKSGPDMPSGTVYYRARFSVKNPDPLFTAGRTELAQGDIFSLKLEYIPEGIVPELETDLGAAIFTRGVPLKDPAADPDSPAAIENMQPEGFASWYAAVPVSNSRATGDYPVTVRAGEQVYEAVVTVTEYDFDYQNLIIDMNVPSNAAAASQAANNEFREKFTPLLYVFSKESYWNGVFIWPVEMGPEDFISTEFGQIRITNGNPNTRRSHNGMDIAVSTGTPVYASNAGRILLAEFLLTTGNTVVIDHGGGLKSIYYHMNSVDTEAGRIVAQGELIGTVGSTGYSTGPHLHFETRIGDQPISPSMLLEPNAGLYSTW